MIDFETPVEKDDDALLPNGHGLTRKLLSNGHKSLKRLRTDTKHSGLKNFEFRPFAQGCALFVEHLSENNLLVISKPWDKVVDTFDAQPVHRHIYGT